MSAEVIIWPHVTRLDVPAQRIAEAADEAGLESIVILGWTRDGDEYFASSIADGGDVNWLLDRLKKQLLEIPETMSEDSAS